MQLSKNFSLDEMCLSPTSIRLGISNVPNTKQIANLQRLVAMILQPVRDHYGLAVHVDSGYRCPSLNRAVGGAVDSQHMRGEAADIRVHGIPNDELFLFIRDHIKDFDQLILERVPATNRHAGWVHVSYAEKLRREAISSPRKGLYVPGVQFAF